MKTFKEFQDEACKKEPLTTYSKINEWAANEYAKQFIEAAYAKGYEDATREACKEIAKNYQPNIK